MTEKLLRHRVHGLQTEYAESMTEKGGKLGQAMSKGNKSENEDQDVSWIMIN